MDEFSWSGNINFLRLGMDSWFKDFFSDVAEDTHFHFKARADNGAANSALLCKCPSPAEHAKSLVAFATAALPVASGFNWMAFVDDDVPLSKLTLPGTHDSACMWNILGKTQDLPIMEQLQLGVRALDLRLCAWIPPTGQGNFALHHSIYYQWSWFDNRPTSPQNTDCTSFILLDCLQFLRDNPTETIVVSVNQENSSVPINDFQTLLRNILASYPAQVYDLNDDTAIPKLGDARGKIFIANREASGLGYFWGGWNLELLFGDSGTRKLSVEDHYTEGFIANKVNYVNRNFHMALANSDAWCITFCSSAVLLPQASALNNAVRDCITQLPPTGNLGVAFFDYPSVDLVRLLYMRSVNTNPKNPTPSLNYSITPWLRERSDVNVDHLYGHDNRIDFPDSCQKIEIMCEDRYGIINLRFYGADGTLIPTSKSGTWISSDTDGFSVFAESPAGASITGISAGYQGGYGIINMQVQYSTGQVSGPLTKYGDVELWTQFVSNPSRLRWVQTWCQPGYGLVDFQSSVVM
jgi:1-phosphatidylinositol phosphodiesterase